MATAQCVQCLIEQAITGALTVELTVHRTYVDLTVSARDPRRVSERFRIRPRKSFADSFACTVGDPRPVPGPRPALWPALDQRREQDPKSWQRLWTAIHQITQSLPAPGADPAATYEAIVTGAVQAMPFTAATLALPTDSGALAVAASCGPPAAFCSVDPTEGVLTTVSGGQHR